MSTVLTVLLIIVSVLLITVIILQPGKSAGLSGASLVELSNYSVSKKQED